MLVEYLRTGDFPVTIRGVSKDIYNATTINRAAKSVLEALIGGLPKGFPVLESVLEWRLLSKTQLASSELAEGTLVSNGTAEWIIKRRSIPVGTYQVKFTASINLDDLSGPKTLKAFNYGFIQSVAGPVIAIIDGGSSVRWGSTGTVTVDGSLSYDGDIGPGVHTGLDFTWSCRGSGNNTSMSYDCSGAFSNENENSTAIIIDTTKLQIGKTYLLRLNVTKDERSASAEMSFEIADGEIPQVMLRYILALQSLMIIHL